MIGIRASQAGYGEFLGAPDVSAKKDVEGSHEENMLETADHPERHTKITYSRGTVRYQYISLRRLLLDAYEYHGLFILGRYIVYFTIALLALFWQWENTTPGFQNAVIQSLNSFDSGNKWEVSNLRDVDSIEEGLEYFSSYLTVLGNRTQSLELANTSILHVGEYAQVTYVRLRLNLENNCIAVKTMPRHKPKWSADMLTLNDRSGQLVNVSTATLNECYRVAAQFPEVTKLSPHWVDVESNQLLPSGLWKRRAYRPAEGRYAPGTFYVELLAQGNDQQSAKNVTTMLRLIEQVIDLDKSFIGKYGFSIAVEMFALSRLGGDAAYFQGRVSLFNENKELIQSTGSQHIRKHLYRPGTNYMAVFFILTIFYIIADINRWTLSYIQSNSVTNYLRCWWNVLALVSNLYSVAWVVGYWIIAHDIRTFTWPVDSTSFDRADAISGHFCKYQYAGIFVLLLVGLRMVRWMNVHLGLKAFYQVFQEAGRMLLDFLVFVIYVLLVLGSALFAFFQISGGNPDFTNWTDGFSAMARLPFGFYEFEQFYNEGSGLGPRFTWTVQVLFWVSVLLLIIFTQNTLLAIFATAYEDVRETTLKVEVHFVMMVLQRVLFFLWFLWNLLLRCICCGCGCWGGSLLKKQDMRAQEVICQCDEAHKEQGLELVDYSQTPSDERRCSLERVWFSLWYQYDQYRQGLARHIQRQWKIYQNEGAKRAQHKMDRQLLFPRWYIAATPELLSLVALYMDISTMKIQTSCTWLALDRQKMQDTARCLPDASALISMNEVEQLFDEIRRKKNQLRGKGGCVGALSTLLGLLWLGPFTISDDLYIQRQILMAIQSVYTFLDRPRTDVENVKEEARKEVGDQASVGIDEAMFQQELQGLKDEMKHEMEMMRRAHAEEILALKVELLNALRVKSSGV